MSRDSSQEMLKYALKMTEKHGIYNLNALRAAGFQYTGDGDKARCKDCELEISNWTTHMDPFDVHLKQKPDCPFIQSMTKYKPLKKRLLSEETTDVPDILQLGGYDISSKRLKIETYHLTPLVHRLLEIDLLVQVRKRGFSHWPHHATPSATEMIEAGFFNCNVGDRVICVYCNLICQQWTPYVDDPKEVHKMLSPNCIYVKAKLTCTSTSSMLIVNDTLTEIMSGNSPSTTMNLELLQSNGIVFAAARHPVYVEPPYNVMHRSLHGYMKI